MLCKVEHLISEVTTIRPYECSTVKILVRNIKLDVDILKTEESTVEMDLINVTRPTTTERPRPESQIQTQACSY